MSSWIKSKPQNFQYVWETRSSLAVDTMNFEFDDDISQLISETGVYCRKPAPPIKVPSDPSIIELEEVIATSQTQTPALKPEMAPKKKGKSKGKGKGKKKGKKDKKKGKKKSEAVSTITNGCTARLPCICCPTQPTSYGYNCTCTVNKNGRPIITINSHTTSINIMKCWRPQSK